ncbi:MAG: hypothetical protein JJE55_08260 [Flavobacteriaceae bacterium]|nr:hypothetical protein [Flavobacteriaceae bacterium]
MKGSEIPQEQIDKWKKQFDVVFRIGPTEKGYVGYCRNATRQEMSFLSVQKDPIKFNEGLLKACWLDGDKEIQERDAIFMGLASQIAQLMHSEEVKMEKL